MGALRLIVGLGNPGPQYAQTRHNVGADWVRELAHSQGISLALDARFKGEIGRGIIHDVDLRLLIPTTYMNNSGEAVGTLARFFKIEPQAILIVHDEVAFAPGIAKLKNGGGDNGHNGLKSIRASLGNQDTFNRLRIGVGHPGQRSRVNAYLTQQTPTQEERGLIQAAGLTSPEILADIFAGRWQSAMTAFHAPEPDATTKQPDESAGPDSHLGES